MRSSVIVVTLLITASAAGASPRPAPAYIAQAVADPSRPADDRAFDAVRKPAAVLEFAGVKPGQAIAEYLPGGGYYTRLLCDAVGPRGKIYALETTTWGKDNIDATKKAIDTGPCKNVSLDLAPLGGFSLQAKADLFFTTDNYHDLHVPKYANVDMAAFNKHVHDLLRPGGLYVIVDHAATPGTGASLSPTLHRIDEGTVIKEVTGAGFKLVAKSDALREPSDDHTKAVFALHFKTDQFMLKFRRE